jgi:tRNA (Thr-GGU) A37 N-methylase
MIVPRHSGTLEQHAREDRSKGHGHDDQKCRGAIRGGGRQQSSIATSIVELVGVEGNTILVCWIDCLDEKPLLDVRADRCESTPFAPPQPRDFETE